jgi:hypothetical protein
MSRSVRDDAHEVWRSRAAKFKDKRIPTPHMTCKYVTVEKYFHNVLDLRPPTGNSILCAVDAPYGYDDKPNEYLYNGSFWQERHERTHVMLHGFNDPRSDLHRGFTAHALGDVPDLKREIFQYANFVGFGKQRNFFNGGYISWPEFWKGFTLEDNRIPLMLAFHPRVGAESSIRRAFMGPLGEKKVISQEILEYSDEYPGYPEKMQRRKKIKERRRGGLNRQPALEHEPSSKAPRLDEEKDVEDMEDE